MILETARTRCLHRLLCHKFSKFMDAWSGVCHTDVSPGVQLNCFDVFMLIPKELDVFISCYFPVPKSSGKLSLAVWAKCCGHMILEGVGVWQCETMRLPLVVLDFPLDGSLVCCLGMPPPPPPPPPPDTFDLAFDGLWRCDKVC